MSTVMLRFGSLVTLLAIAWAAPVRAETRRARTVPPGAEMRVTRRIDAAAFARSFAARYTIELRRVIATDIDRDGDIDVLAATDRGLLVWVNDGTGRLTSQAPKRLPAVLDPPGDTWHHDKTSNQDTIQNDVPALRLPASRAHAPPAAVSACAGTLDQARPSNVTRGIHIPRAPPPAD